MPNKIIVIKRREQGYKSELPVDLYTVYFRKFPYFMLKPGSDDVLTL